MPTENIKYKFHLKKQKLTHSDFNSKQECSKIYRRSKNIKIALSRNKLLKIV